MSGEASLGLAAALAAAACYEASYAVQALEARDLDRHTALRASPLLVLVRRPRWVGAILLAVVGFGLQVLALGLAPLTLVQPAVASGLLLLLYLGVRVLGERVTLRDLAGAGAIVAGVGGMAVAAPARADSVAGPVTLSLVLGTVAMVTFAPYLLRMGTRMPGVRIPGVVLVASAGAGDAWAAFAARLVSGELSDGRILAAIAWAAGAGSAVLVGLTSETTALQRLPATRVAPFVLVIQTALPVLLAPLLVGEAWGATPLGGWIVGTSLAAVAAGAGVLASSRAAGGLLAPVPARGAGAVEHQ